MVQPRLVNDVFGDPGLLLDFSFGKRALLFDLGDLTSLSTREILRVQHVFVSHMHMDHFIGFDHLLRLFLHRDAALTIFGPLGIIDAVQAKLRAYTWNLLDETSPDFIIRAVEWNAGNAVKQQSFKSRWRFAPGIPSDLPISSHILYDEPNFHVEAARLDHGIPSLAFAFQERLRVNVHKVDLERCRLPVGPWLTEAKRLVRGRADPQTAISIDGERQVILSDLLASGALVTAPGMRVVYATDFAFTPANVNKIARLARNADYLFIESVFLEQDMRLAESKRHLTARQAGQIAAAAKAARRIPMHFSPRYLGREAELQAEFETAARGE